MRVWGLAQEERTRLGPKTEAPMCSSWAHYQRCGYHCTRYGLVHGRLAICLRIISRVLINHRYVGIPILGALLIVFDRVLMIAVCAYNLCACLYNYSLGVYVHSHHECPTSARRSGCIREVTPTQV